MGVILEPISEGSSENSAGAILKAAWCAVRFSYYCFGDVAFLQSFPSLLPAKPGFPPPPLSRHSWPRTPGPESCPGGMGLQRLSGLGMRSKESSRMQSGPCPGEAGDTSPCLSESPTAADKMHDKVFAYIAQSQLRPRVPRLPLHKRKMVSWGRLGSGRSLLGGPDCRRQDPKGLSVKSLKSLGTSSGCSAES